MSRTRAQAHTNLALCLSGGGFRAALFHLGTLRRLNELGILSQIDTISSVSGGSIIAAHLAQYLRPWPQHGTIVSVDEWEERIAVPFRAFTRHNHRTGPLLKRLLPWNWLRPSTTVDALAAHYAQLVQLRLPELPDRPRFIFCATDMAFGVNWVFEKDQVGDYQAGYLRPAPPWPVARAVAASSCFPPVFPPQSVGVKPAQLTGGHAPIRQRQRANLRLTDGGVYDNLGLEPVWRSHAAVLVSDGGALFDVIEDYHPLLRPLQHVLRYSRILDNQVRSLRKRRLVSGFKTGKIAGTYWRISGVAREYNGYSKPMVESIICKVRTDLDAFSEAEIAVLENHGYLLVEAAVRRHAPELILPNALPAVIPHPQWMDEQLVREHLAQSYKRGLLGRN